MDFCSPRARRNQIADWFIPVYAPGELWLYLLLPIKLLLFPVYLGYVYWRCRQAQPGWKIDFAQGRVQAVRQHNNGCLQLEPGLGLLAHHRRIEITHPINGPLLTLFTATCSRSAADQQAQERLAQLLAERLRLRLVGLRVDLS